MEVQKIGDGPTTTDAPPSMRRVAGEAMRHAAVAWLAELDEEQLEVAWWGGPGGEDEVERRLWFYAPTDHGGLTLNGQFPRQQRRAMQLVASGLSSEGYALVSTIMGTENILDHVEGFSSEFDTRRGRDPSRYYLRVFGNPDGDGPWAWRFGGHHISLSFLIAGGEVRATTPRFLGLDPAVTTLPGGALLDPLHGFQALGHELVTSLPASARAEAILLDRAPPDIVLGNRPAFEHGATVPKLNEIFRRRAGDEELMEAMRVGGDARDAVAGYGPRDHEALSVTTAPKGIAGADLDPGQRDTLDRLVRIYHASIPHGITRAWDLDRLHFAWAGPLKAGTRNYYRIQGDDLLIEWDNTARNANHAHGVIRDLTSDFGNDVLGHHRQIWH